jgi:hypothetical protein
VLPLVVLVILVTYLLPEGRPADEDDEDEQPPARPSRRGAPTAGAFPVPPIDLVVPPSPRLQPREPVTTVPATDADVIDSDDPRTGENR